MKSFRARGFKWKVCDEVNGSDFAATSDLGGSTRWPGCGVLLRFASRSSVGGGREDVICLSARVGGGGLSARASEAWRLGAAPCKKKTMRAERRGRRRARGSVKRARGLEARETGRQFRDDETQSVWCRRRHAFTFQALVFQGTHQAPHRHIGSRHEPNTAAHSQSFGCALCNAVILRHADATKHLHDCNRYLIAQEDPAKSTTLRRLSACCTACHPTIPVPLFQTPFAASPFLLPSVTPGIGTGPPGESGNLAVRTSTPSSVTSSVCSN